MKFDVVEMPLSETDLVIDYFLEQSKADYHRLGVDPTRLPTAEQWRRAMAHDFARPYAARDRLFLSWRRDGVSVGFSSCNKIIFGGHAFMHLHLFQINDRGRGLGAAFVKKSVHLYCEVLNLTRIYCAPHALNTAPHRTLQAAGFRFQKAFETTPGPINFHQTVLQWAWNRRVTAP